MSEETVCKIIRTAVGLIIIAGCVMVLSGVLCVSAGLIRGAVTGAFPELTE